MLGSAAACAQTDVALSVYGAFNGTTNGNGTVQSPVEFGGRDDRAAAHFQPYRGL